MKLGLVGFGKMGGDIARRLINNSHEVIVYDREIKTISQIEKAGGIPANSIKSLVNLLPRDRTVWTMLPAGKETENMVSYLGELLDENDTVIDGGNSYYKDSVRRFAQLSKNRVHFLDVGTSGGIWGLDYGFSMMIGGDRNIYDRNLPIFQALAVEGGYGYVGPPGSGHFVKMIHNGIEYGMMQAFAEGFEILDAKDEFNLDLRQIAGIWRHGSVVRSWLLDLIAGILEDDQKLSDTRAYVEDSGEGRWSLMEAIDLNLPVPVMAAALHSRFRSRQTQPFGSKLLAALRNEFGGHTVRKIHNHQPK